MPKSNKRKTEQQQQAPAQMLYPKKYVVVREGEDALKVEDSKEILGWTEVEGANFHIVDRYGKKIFFANNTKNRPFYKSKCEELVRKHLRLLWRFNFEPITIGQYGAVCDGQHSCASHVLAEQDREKAPTFWAKNWPGPVTMAKAVAYGCSEDDETMNTMGLGKPRTGKDVIYRGPYFVKFPPDQRRFLSTMAESAVGIVWKRTGRGKKGERRTNEETALFLDLHPHMVKACVFMFGLLPSEKRSVQQAEREKRLLPDGIHKMIGVGYASGLLYLMAATDSDSDSYNRGAYRNDNGPPEEKYADLGYWDRAKEFWMEMKRSVEVVDRITPFKPVVDALKALRNPVTDKGGSNDEKFGIIAHAWHWFHQGDTITADRVKLARKMDDGIQILDDWPLFGGIDLGSPNSPENKKKSEEVEDEGESTVEEPKTKEQTKAEREAKRRSDADEIIRRHKAKKEAEPSPGNEAKKSLEKLRKEAPGCILVHKFSKGSDLMVYDVDAHDVVRIAKGSGLKVNNSYPDGLARLTVPGPKWSEIMDRLFTAGKRIAIVETMNGKDTVTPVDQPKAVKKHK